MTNTRKALEMAIETLEAFEITGYCDETIQACKEALEQPAQEPVAKQYLVVDENDCHGDGSIYRGLRGKDSSIPTYRIETHPAPSWQGLTDDEINSFYGKSTYEGLNGFARAIEQALKEKNHD